VSILETVKDVVSLVQKVDNIDLLKQILSLQSDVQKLYGENLALREDVALLKEKLRLKETLRFHDGNYFLIRNDGSEDGPFCQICHDVDGKLVRLVNAMYGEPICTFCTIYRNRQRS
jgi:hypothetical protein